MPIISMPVVEGVSQPVSFASRTIESLLSELAEVRYNRELMGITIGQQVITTYRHERADWRERYDHAGLVLAGSAKEIAELADTNGLYPYKPYEEIFGVLLTPQQVRRAYECIRWYVNTCFATEIAFQQMIIAPNADLAALAAVIANPQSWPIREMSWST